MPAADYFRYMAQFCFAADRNVGDLLSPEEKKEHNADPRARHQMVGQLGGQGDRSGNQIGGASAQPLP